MQLVWFQKCTSSRPVDVPNLNCPDCRIICPELGKTISIHKFPVIFALFQIQPTLGEWRPASKKSRREKVVISRLRIGLTILTHTFMLQLEVQPQWLTCQTICTVKPILIECRTFAVIRKRFFKVTSLTELFENIIIDDFLSFLRDTG